MNDENIKQRETHSDRRATRICSLLHIRPLLVCVSYNSFLSQHDAVQFANRLTNFMVRVGEISNDMVVIHSHLPDARRILRSN